ncbi:putative baseplate J [uncultured Caudovirales phage]|uniref:Putative baseplate J n=1 Tax=uncultured Caudovirales phage TaxID=2100421 RepID=A0A2H4J4A0_9CAUD|nr:putative baseplate J [uncultured Caudovirales phage]
MGRYNNRTAADILTDMLANTRNDIDKRQGSVAHDMLAPPAHEIEMLGWELEAVYLQAYLDTATDEALDMLAHHLGIYRKSSVSAAGIANVTGADGTIIPKGYRFKTVSDIEFTSNLETTITNGIAFVAITAVIPGESGNIGIGELTDHERNLSGISSVTNNDIFIGGVDAETDDSLRERALFKARKPITSGNVNHYKLWATEVEGVATANVFPTWNGPNTVKVVLIADDGGAPDQPIIDDAIAYIEQERPIGAKVTVLPIEEVPLSINAKLTLSGDLNVADVRDAIIESITHYFLSESDGGVVRYSRVGEAILGATGVIDYEDLLINNATSNISLSQEQVAIVGEVILA